MRTVDYARNERQLPVPREQTVLSIPDRDATSLAERAGPFDIRFATDDADVTAAQRLRYDVFYGEGRAIADRAVARTRRDLCPFDDICDHLLVFDTDPKDAPGETAPLLVGTYRLLRREIAEGNGGFYSQGEFDLAPLLARHPDTRFLELGRSCVHPAYRSKRVIELLWRGLWLYARLHDAEALIGCASLPGTDVEAHRLPLSFLHHFARAEPAWQAAPRSHCAARFLPSARNEIDARRDLLTLPPLLKGYLRAGARFSPGAVLDRQFGTTDVFTVMPMAELDGRYKAHYGQPSCLSEVPVA